MIQTRLLSLPYSGSGGCVLKSATSTFHVCAQGCLTLQSGPLRRAHLLSRWIAGWPTAFVCPCDRTWPEMAAEGRAFRRQDGHRVGTCLSLLSIGDATAAQGGTTPYRVHPKSASCPIWALVAMLIGGWRQTSRLKRARGPGARPRKNWQRE